MLYNAFLLFNFQYLRAEVPTNIETIISKKNIFIENVRIKISFYIRKNGFSTSWEFLESTRTASIIGNRFEAAKLIIET